MNEPTFQSFKNHFLIAMPRMVDPSFAGTLTLVCEHSPEGAFGIIINRPMVLTFHEILKQSGFEVENGPSQEGLETVYAGGPVAMERGFVLHTGHHCWQSSVPVSDNLQLTSSKDILLAITRDDGPEESLIALGYAGWGRGQLETELSDNVWLTCEAEQHIIFSTPFQYRLEAAAHSIGVDIRLISHEVGHA